MYESATSPISVPDILLLSSYLKVGRVYAGRVGELKEPTVEAFGNYVHAFMSNAKPFYFGDNSSGWRASFDYLLRSDTLTKTREGSL